MSKTEQRESSVTWRKSSYSIANGQCVEAATIPGAGVLIRDATRPAGGNLRFPAEAWQEFTAGIKGA
jgi:hypothetical protein